MLFISGLVSGWMMNTVRGIVTVMSPTDLSAQPALSSAFGMVWLLTCGKMKITTQLRFVTRTDTEILKLETKDIVFSASCFSQLQGVLSAQCGVSTCQSASFPD